MKLLSAFFQTRRPVRWLSGETVSPWLDSIAHHKINLEYPVFFIPGQGDENAGFWTRSSVRGSSLTTWVERLARDPRKAYWVNFVNEHRLGRGTSELAESLCAKVRAVTGGQSPFDVIAAPRAAATVLAAFSRSVSAGSLRTCVLLDPSVEELNMFQQKPVLAKNLWFLKSEASATDGRSGERDRKPDPFREISIAGFSGRMRWAAESPQLIEVILKILSGAPLS